LLRIAAPGFWQRRTASLQFAHARVDTTGMLPTWTLERGMERITLFCRETRRGVVLVVSGDGDLRSYSFQDFAALAQFEHEMEEFLLHTGWSRSSLAVRPSDPVPAGRSPQTPQPTERHRIMH
jgi:hypothetical protein